MYFMQIRIYDDDDDAAVPGMRERGSLWKVFFYMCGATRENYGEHRHRYMMSKTLQREYSEAVWLAISSSVIICIRATLWASEQSARRCLRTTIALYFHLRLMA